ncbi:hypothetical protein FQR65_LT19009 [Abscondita terminalis]|nr:hypothetical protein FQR65_LT19009 [Abscondita terminalis]
MPPHIGTDLKARIVSELAAGRSVREVSRMLDIPKSTVGYYRVKWNREQTLERAIGSGRPKVSTRAQNLELLHYVTEQPFATYFRAIADTHFPGCRITAQKILKEMGVKKSGSEAKLIKKYIYAEQLRFLEKSMELRATDSSIPETPEQENSSGADKENDNDVEETAVQQVTPTTLKQPMIVNTGKRAPKSYNVEEKLISYMDAHQPKQPKVENDEDLSFFKSVLPSIRKLNSDQKFTFRLYTLKTVQSV